VRHGDAAWIGREARSIVAASLSGREGGFAQSRVPRTALDAAIVEVPTVAQLPRRAAIHHAAKGLTAVR